MSLKSVQLAKVDIESGPSSGGDVPVAQTDGPLKRDMTLWGFFANNLKHIPRESSYPPVPVFGLHEQMFQKRPNCQSNSQIRHQIAA